MINKQILDITIFNEKEREQKDYYELNNLEYDPAKKLVKDFFRNILVFFEKRTYYHFYFYFKR